MSENFRNQHDEMTAISEAAGQFAADNLLNKRQVGEKILEAYEHGKSDLPSLLTRYLSHAVVQMMPDDSFCSVVEIIACFTNKKPKQCVCTKKLLFGKDVEVCAIEVFDKAKEKCKPKFVQSEATCEVNDTVPCEAGFDELFIEREKFDKCERKREDLADRLAACEAHTKDILDALRGKGAKKMADDDHV